MIHNKFLLGSDPEFAGYSKKENKFKSLVGLLGGTKEQPLPIEIEGCAVQEDNVNAEFTVPPSESLNQLIENIHKCVSWGNNYLKSKDIELVAKSSAKYDAKELESENAQMFGCDPSYCVYTGSMTLLPSPQEVSNLRCSGFHIHFGFDKTYTESEYTTFIKLCDAFLGIPSLIHDKDEDRRKIYGSLGDFRYQPWGLEYRTMGSGMFNFPQHISYGIGAISRILELDKAEEFVTEISAMLYDIFGEQFTGYKSKQKIWKEIHKKYLKLI